MITVIIEILEPQFGKALLLTISQEIAYTTITVRTSQRSTMTEMVVLLTVRNITTQGFGMIQLIMLIRMACMGTKMPATVVMFIGTISEVTML